MFILLIPSNRGRSAKNLLDGTKFKADIEDPDWSAEEAQDFALQSGFGFVTKGSSNEPCESAYQQMAQMYGYRKTMQTQAPDGRPQVVSRALDMAGTGQATSTTAASQVGATSETLPANWSPSTSGQGTDSSGLAG
jgi:hypothetical protein